MLLIRVFGTTPPCANCKRAEREAQKAAEGFPGQVEVLKLDAMDSEADAFGLMTTPLVVVGNEVVGSGRVIPEKKLSKIIAAKLEG